MAYLAPAVSDIHKVKKIDKGVFDGLFNGKKVGNKHFEAFLLEKLVKDETPFFEPFFKAAY